MFLKIAVLKKLCTFPSYFFANQVKAGCITAFTSKCITTIRLLLVFKFNVGLYT